ncbi:hypothetical protein FKM82_027452 [Ascaphus truei]
MGSSSVRLTPSLPAKKRLRFLLESVMLRCCFYESLLCSSADRCIFEAPAGIQIHCRCFLVAPGSVSISCFVWIRPAINKNKERGGLSHVEKLDLDGAV